MNNFKNALNDAKGKLGVLIAERAEVDAHIHRLQQLIRQLAVHAGVDADTELSELTAYEHRGLTSGIRSALKESGKWKTAAEVRHILLSFGYDLSDYANSSAVINTILNRLVKQKFVEKDTKEGAAKYRWKTAGQEIFKRAWTEIKGRK